MAITGKQLRPVVDLLRHIAAHQRATEQIFKRQNLTEEFKKAYQEEWKKLEAGQIQHWSSPNAQDLSISDTELGSLLRVFLRKP